MICETPRKYIYPYEVKKICRRTKMWQAKRNSGVKNLF